MESTLTQANDCHRERDTSLVTGWAFGLCGLLEELAGLDFEVEGNVGLQVADPLVVAREEFAVLVDVGRQGFEGGTRVALFVGQQMLGQVVSHKRVKQVQLEVVRLVELLAGHCLRVCVVIVLVAAVSTDAAYNGLNAADRAPESSAA